MEDQGFQDEQRLRSGGATEDQINSWKADQVATLQKGGLGDDEINKYFGVKKTDTKAMKAYVDKNLADFHDSRKGPDGSPPKEAASWGEYFDAGWENSVTGLAKAGHLPDTVMPEHASFAGRLISNVAQITGDLPAMLAGSVAGSMVGAGVGGTAGSVVPVAGTLGGIAIGSVTGAGAGAFAAPAAMRKLLMDHYEKGDVQDAGDFMARLASVTWEATKGGVIGAATAGAGMLAKPVAGAMGSLAAELTTMTTAGAAMEGRLPQPQEFLDGAAMLGGFHLVTGTLPTKLRDIYANTGERPLDIVNLAHEDPVLKQQLESENPNLPEQATPKTFEDRLLGKEGQDESGGKGKEPPGPPSEPPTPDEANLAKDQKNILSMVAAKKEVGGPSILSREWFGQKWDRAYASLIDRNDPILQAEKESGGDFEGKNSPFKRISSFPGWKGIAESFISRPTDWRGNVVEGGGTVDAKTGKINGESLESALSSVPKDKQQDFMAYALSRRVLERTEAGFKVATGDKVESAKNVVASGEQFKESFQRVVDWNNRVMQYARDKELISKASFDNMSSGSKDYIPLMVAQDFDEFTGKLKGNDGGLYKEMDEGSAKQKTNPIEQMMRNGMRIIKAAELNEVKKSYGDMVDAAPEGRAVGEKIEKPTGADNEISFKRDGELQTYRIPADKAEAIKSMNFDPGKTALWARMLIAPASWLRTGTVLNPDFIVRHGERSMFVSAVQSASGLGGVFKAPVDVARAVYQNFAAIGDIMQNSQAYQDFLRSGGAQSSIFGIEDYLGKQNIWKLDQEAGGNVLTRAWNSALSPLEYAAHLSDNLARVAEFKRAGGVGADAEGAFKAGYAARNVTIDYMRAGAQIKAVSSFVPFMNIGIQGLDRMARGWNADKLGFTARAAAALTVPTLLNWAVNRNDSRYQDAPNWEKDLYWIIPTNKWEKAANLADAQSRPEDMRRLAADGTWEVNNGTTLKISKPFELGLLFASVPERLLNRFADDDPRAAGELVSTLLHGALPNILPTALTPVLEQSTNKNFFTGRPVVSSHVEGMLPEYQYNEYTSNVAKTLGKLIGYVPLVRDIGPKDAKLASPQVIDNYIHDWSGTMGQYVLQALNKGQRVYSGEVSPTSTLAEMPIIKAFISRNPSQNAQPIQDFYNDYDKASRLNATMKAHPEQAIQLMKDNPGDMLQLTEIKKSLSSIAKSLQAINESPGISANDKRQLMDAAYYQMSMIAKQGNRIIDANRKALNAKQ